jgi:hypothetical protein
LFVSLADKLKSADIRKQLGTTAMVEEIKEHKRKWHINVGRMLSVRLTQKHIFLEDSPSCLLFFYFLLYNSIMKREAIIYTETSGYL